MFEKQAILNLRNAFEGLTTFRSTVLIKLSLFLLVYFRYFEPYLGAYALIGFRIYVSCEKFQESGPDTWHT